MLNVDATNIDIIIGSLAGCVSSAGGFCTGASLMVEHQRLNSPALTFSASLPTFMATTASEVITRLQSAQGAELLRNLQDRTAALRHQLVQSDWVRCTSAPQNPVIMLVLKEEHVRARNLSRSQQETLLQECVDEVGNENPLIDERSKRTDLRSQALSSHNILITRLKTLPLMEGLSPRDSGKEWLPVPAIKVCATSALSQKDIGKAGVSIRHAIATVVKKRQKWRVAKG